MRSVSWLRSVAPSREDALPWRPPWGKLALALQDYIASQISSMTRLKDNHSWVLFCGICLQTSHWADAAHLKTQRKQQGADKRMGPVFLAEVKSWITFRWPWTSLQGARSFSNTVLWWVPKQPNKQLQRNTNKQGKQSRLLSWLQFSPKKFWLDGYTKGTHLFSSIHIVLYVYMFQPFSR